MYVYVKSLSRVRLFATPWTAAYQAPPSMGFSRQEYWSGLPFPYPGDLPDPGIEPRSSTLQADALTSDPPGITEPTPCARHCYRYFMNITSLNSYNPHHGGDVVMILMMLRIFNVWGNWGTRKLCKLLKVNATKWWSQAGTPGRIHPVSWVPPQTRIHLISFIV